MSTGRPLSCEHWAALGARIPARNVWSTGLVLSAIGVLRAREEAQAVLRAEDDLPATAVADQGGLVVARGVANATS